MVSRPCLPHAWLARAACKAISTMLSMRMTPKLCNSHAAYLIQQARRDLECVSHVLAHCRPRPAWLNCGPSTSYSIAGCNVSIRVLAGMLLPLGSRLHTQCTHSVCGPLPACPRLRLPSPGLP